VSGDKRTEIALDSVNIMTSYNTTYRVVEKKIARSLMQPFATESRGFHQHAQERLSTSQCKICISWLNIRW